MASRQAMAPDPATTPSIPERLGSLDWARIETELNERGCATTGVVLTPGECRQLADDYDSEASFRSRVVMARHGFGKGEYKYYAYPLPPTIAELRNSLYPRLAPIANRWQRELGSVGDYPAEHNAFLERCHEAEQ